MVKQLFLVLSQDPYNTLFLNLEKILYKQNFQYTSLDFSNLFLTKIIKTKKEYSSDKETQDEFINQNNITFFYKYYSNTEYTLYLKKKILNLWLFQNRIELRTKDIFLLCIETNIETLYENILFKNLNDHINTMQLNCRVIIHVNYQFIKNPYYFLLCMIKVGYVQNELDGDMIIYLEKSHISCSNPEFDIRSIKNLEDLINLMISIYKTSHVLIAQLLLMLKKKIFKCYDIRVLTNVYSIINIYNSSN